MLMKTYETFKAAQTRYKQYFDQLGRSLPRFRPGDYVYVDGPPAVRTVGERMEVQPRSKLLPKLVGQFLFSTVTLHMIAINEDGI